MTKPCYHTSAYKFFIEQGGEEAGLGWSKIGEGSPKLEDFFIVLSEILKALVTIVCNWKLYEMMTRRSITKLGMYFNTENKDM